MISGHKTGIQRVVREIVRRKEILSEKSGIPWIPVIALGCHFYPLSQFEGLNRGRKSLREIFLEAGKTIFQRVDRLFKRVIQVKKVEKNDCSGAKEDSRESVGAFLKQSGRNGLISLLMLPLRIRAQKKIDPLPGDILLMADIFWGMEDPLRAAKTFHSKGGEVLPVIYDLIPLRFPELCHEGTVLAFSRSFNQIMLLANRVLTVSRASRDDIITELSQNVLYRQIGVDFFYLGADLPQESKDNVSRSIRSEFEKFGKENTFYLMVGTVQPHKGHLVVLNAFEKLWEEGFVASLFILGRIGGKGDEVFSQLKKNKYFGKKLFIFQNATDSELDFLYAQSKALILASFAEGFGLPLVEAMRKGVPVIASRIPSFQEISDDYPIYFKAGSSEDLIKVIEEYEGGERNRQSERSGGWIGWDSAVTGLIKKVLGENLTLQRLSAVGEQADLSPPPLPEN